MTGQDEPSRVLEYDETSRIGGNGMKKMKLVEVEVSWIG